MMDFMHANEVKVTASDVVFRESAVVKFLLSLVLASLAAGMVFAWRYMSFPLPVLILSVGVLLSMALISGHVFIRSLSSENWLMIVTGEDIYIKLGSYLEPGTGRHEKEVVRIPLSKLEAVGALSIKRVSRGADRNDRRERLSFLEVVINPAGLGQITDRLGRLKEVKKSSFRHFPVTVTQGAIRLAFLGATTRVSPGLKKALKLFEGRQVTVRPLRLETQDFRTKASSSQAKVEIRILELVESGRDRDAIHLVMKLYDFNLTEATRFVKELRNHDRA